MTGPHHSHLHRDPHARPPKVVVGVDGSNCSKIALRWAAQLAKQYGAQLEAVSAWHFPVGYGIVMAPNFSPGDLAEKALTETVDEVFGSDRPADMWLAVRPGAAAQVLVEQSEDALLLVVGSRGRGGFAGLRLGSVSSSVAAHAGCPVLVVHGDRIPSEVQS